MLLPAEPNDEIAEDEVAIFRYIEKDGVLEAIEDEHNFSAFPCSYLPISKLRAQVAW